MEYTSSEAAKLLRQLNEELEALRSKEKQCSTFNAALGEDVESVRPTYAYEEMQERLEVVQEKIIKVKHALNIFNCNQQVPGFDKTIDQLLVYLPMLSYRKQKLAEMVARLPKQRVNLSAYDGTRMVVDYCYVNYDLEKVRADYKKVTDELSRAQNALDVINTTVKFTIEL